VEALLPVRIWGVDAHAQPFMQLASTRNITATGVVVQGLKRQIRPGEIIEVQFAGVKAEFRVLWAGKPGTARDGEIGLEILASEPCIWDVNLDRCVQVVGNG
jgi:hypothetical protein